MAHEKRLIDANALMDEFRRYMVERCDREKCVSEEKCKTCEKSCLWRKIVSAAPTVDAVEVVRCKDCKHFYRDDEFNRAWCGYDKCVANEVAVNGYCYRGERKDNG